MDDQALLRRFRDGDRRAFEALIDRHEAALLRYATRLTGNRELAREAAQEAFLALVRGRKNGVDPDTPAAWLFRVARNKAKEAQKKEIRMRRRHQTVALREVSDPPEPPLETRETAHVLLEQFAHLEAEVREVLTLKIQEEKSYREIASITGFSLGKISSLVHRGLTELSRALRAAGVV